MRQILGDTKKIESLLDQKANIHTQKDDALRWAAEYKRTETVKLLLKQ